jgi:integron integrase
MDKPPVKLLDLVRQRIRLKGYSIHTEKTYCEWIKRYIFYHNKRHPREMGRKDIEKFLSHLVMDRNVAPSTQNQAFNAILFLYRNLLEMDMPDNIQALRSKKPVRVPTVMTREEAHKVINLINGEHQLMVKILYGCGLRTQECLRLRVKDVDFALNQTIVRDGKGKVDRITMLPDSIKDCIIAHLKYVQGIHPDDLRQGYGRVYLPYALERKYPNADKQWGWQYVFPSKQLSEDPMSGATRRHHIHGSSIRRAVYHAAKRSGIVKPIGCHTFRHYDDFRIMPNYHFKS